MRQGRISRPRTDHLNFKRWSDQLAKSFNIVWPDAKRYLEIAQTIGPVSFPRKEIDSSSAKTSRLLQVSLSGALDRLIIKHCESLCSRSGRAGLQNLRPPALQNQARLPITDQVLYESGYSLPIKLLCQDIF
jgi:hypothetical protein